MNSIPASTLVNIIPGVLGAGGNPLALNAVFVDSDPSIPFGTVQPFNSLQAVENWYGPNSNQAALAAAYFSGFIGCEQLPDLLYFVQWNQSAIAAYVRGSSVAGLTLAQLQALSGVIDITVNGEVVSSANINLASATSFSNAAALITTGLDTTGDIFQGTAAAVGSLMTVTVVTSGALHVGDVVTGTGVPSNSIISSFGTGSGGTGTYNLSTSGGFSSTTVYVTSGAVCTYDSLRQAFVITSPTTGANSTMGYASGSLAAPLFLTAAAGATLSQGAAISTPASVMNTVVASTQNWATFMATAEPTLANKLAFATWLQGQNQKYAFVCYDSDPTALNANATGSFGYLTANDTGCIAIWNPSGLVGAFVCGTTASIDFDATNGRITYAYKGQAGLIPDVTNAQTAANLLSNGYNFYGAYATANQQFLFLQNGKISGAWDWIDPYIDQIYFNAQFQLNWLELLANINSVPYTPIGYNTLYSAQLSTIKQMKAFGALVAGGVLSSSQILEVNAAAGANAAAAIQTVGWYMSITDPGAIIRGQRGSPDAVFYYFDGGAIQTITMNSVDVE